MQNPGSDAGVFVCIGNQQAHQREYEAVPSRMGQSGNQQSGESDWIGRE
jgi:hypothetical protein